MTTSTSESLGARPDLSSVTIDLSEFLAYCGRDLPQPEQVHYEVTRDSIRRVAYAVEDFNALYLDEEFARQTRWGGIIALPGYLYSHGRQFLAWPRHLGKITDSDGNLFDVSNNMGEEWEFFRAVRPGDTVLSTSRPVDGVLKRSRQLGIFALCTSETTFVNQRGDAVARYRGFAARWSAERQKQVGALARSYPKIAPGQVTRSVPGPSIPPDRVRRFDRDEVFFEDVTEGMEIPEMIIGPVSLTSTRRFEMQLADMCRAEAGTTPTAGGHVPDRYAAGMYRVPWFASFVTRWTGPNAWIRKITNRNREWVLVGFRYFCRGRVSRKFIEDGRRCIECDVTIENEFGAVTNTGSLIVELRSRL